MEEGGEGQRGEGRGAKYVQGINFWSVQIIPGLGNDGRREGGGVGQGVVLAIHIYGTPPPSLSSPLPLSLTEPNPPSPHNTHTYIHTINKAGWVGLGWDGLDWVGLGWVGMDWVGLGWVGLGWVSSGARGGEGQIINEFG